MCLTCSGSLKSGVSKIGHAYSRWFVGRPILVWEGNNENSTYIQLLMFTFKIYFYGELVFTEFQSYKITEVLEMCCRTMWIYFNPFNTALKHG